MNRRSGRGTASISHRGSNSRDLTFFLPPSRMSTPPLDGSLNWRRGELPRGDDGRRLWDHSPPKSSEDSGSPSRAVALFPARPALHSAFPIVESADSSSEAGDAKVRSSSMPHCLCLNIVDRQTMRVVRDLRWIGARIRCRLPAVLTRRLRSA